MGGGWKKKMLAGAGFGGKGIKLRRWRGLEVERCADGEKKRVQSKSFSRPFRVRREAWLEEIRIQNTEFRIDGAEALGKGERMADKRVCPTDRARARHWTPASGSPKAIRFLDEI